MNVGKKCFDQGSTFYIYLFMALFDFYPAFLKLKPHPRLIVQYSPIYLVQIVLTIQVLLEGLSECENIQMWQIQSLLKAHGKGPPLQILQITSVA